ncbi:MAG: DUF5916 domain-containing protein [Candidatus Aminicenantes bacterium RBG_16_66_30]
MPHRRRRLLTWPILPALFALAVVAIAAQEPAKRLNVSCIATPPPKIDGVIDDACWKGVEPVSGFYQYDPINGAKASEETLVWSAFDQDYLYFAFLMKDSQPSKIWAELTPRNEYENNDSVTLILDAYNDKRSSITFAVNPRGVQKNSVETIWKSEAVIRPDGWSAEMAIPFKSLRFSAKKLAVWGVNFERTIHRLNETDYWTDVDRDLPKLQQSGELCGLTGLRPGYNLEFFPYAGVRTSEFDVAEGRRDTDTKSAIGLDAKWGIKPNLYLDVTASPDFSEVESDPFIFQLSPYENYFQENRPFFTEGSRYFSLGENNEYHGGGVSLFYSRRIRNPRGAAKISGKTGGFGFGILGAINKIDVGPGEDPRDSYFGVFRVQKDILKNSQVGVYYAGVRDGDARNQNIAVDFNFNFKDYYYLQGMGAFTFNEGVPNRRNGIYQLNFRAEPDAGLQLASGFQRIENNVNITTGYIDQKDVQSFDLMVGHAWRFDKGMFKRFSFDFSGAVRQDSFGNATGQNGEFFIWSELFNRIEAHGGFQVGRSKYQVLDVNDSLVWTPDYVRTWGGNLDVSWDRGGFLKEIGVEAGWEKRGVYNEEYTAVVPGAETTVEGVLVLRPRSNLEWSAEGGWIRQTADSSGAEVFDGLAYETALHYQLTRSLFLNTRFNGETRENQYSLDFLVGYYFGAGNIVQLALKKSERNQLLGRVGGYSITLKVSYLLRI